MRLIAVAAGLLVASFQSGWAAERSTETPQHWLERMARSLHTLNYQGTFVYASGPRMETISLQHTVDEQGEREHLIALNGAPREVLRDGAAVTRILPEASSIFSQPDTPSATFPMALGEAFSHLDQFYSFQLGDSERIADRETQQIHVNPRDSYRYGYRLWLDRQTAIPLKAALLDEEGYPLEQVMFTSFRLMQEDESASRTAESPTVSPALPAEPARRARKEIATTPWKIKALPDGFELFSHIKETLPGSSQPVDHVVFSDGLVSVSAYMERMSDRKGLNGISRLGAFSAFGLNLEDYQVTVVGEVPPATVEFIGRAIVLGPDTQ